MMNQPVACPFDEAMERRHEILTKHELRISSLEQSRDTIVDSLEKINTNISRLVWMVLAAMVVAVMKFVLSGGLV